MKSIKYNPVIFKMLLASAVLFACTSGKGYCQYGQYEQEQGYSILIEASPADAGLVTPEPGVHRIGFNETVLLTATPKPGYRFVYWLGDVGNLTANETTIKLDSPKIVIAVFEREEFSLLTPSIQPQKGRGSGEAGAAAASGFTPVDPMASPRLRRPPRPVLVLPDQDLLPIPGAPPEDDGEEDEPAPDEPIPEPATIVLFGLGAVAVLRRKRRD